MSSRETEVAEAIEGLSQMLREARSTNSATISVQAGGVGVWIATCCCSMMLGVGLVVGSLYLDQQRQIGELRAYLAAIYMQAPYLKPKDADE